MPVPRLFILLLIPCLYHGICRGQNTQAQVYLQPGVIINYDPQAYRPGEYRHYTEPDAYKTALVSKKDRSLLDICAVYTADKAKSDPFSKLGAAAFRDMLSRNVSKAITFTKIFTSADNTLKVYRVSRPDKQKAIHRAYVVFMDKEINDIALRFVYDYAGTDSGRVVEQLMAVVDAVRYVPKELRETEQLRTYLNRLDTALHIPALNIAPDNLDHYLSFKEIPDTLLTGDKRQPAYIPFTLIKQGVKPLFIEIKEKAGEGMSYRDTGAVVHTIHRFDSLEYFITQAPYKVIREWYGVFSFNGLYYVAKTAKALTLLIADTAHRSRGVYDITCIDVAQRIYTAHIEIKGIPQRYITVTCPEADCTKDGDKLTLALHKGFKGNHIVVSTRIGGQVNRAIGVQQINLDKK